MKNAIIVSPKFDAIWPFTADHLQQRWSAKEPVQFVRTEIGSTKSAGDLLARPSDVVRLISLGLTFTVKDLHFFPNLREVVLSELPHEHDEALKAAGISVHRIRTESFWGQSVSEFVIGLTIAALRRIPQTYAALRQDMDTWNYAPPRPGARGVQFADDPKFTNGTIAGKRVRIVGIGNIGSRYASFCAALGADVAAWDPLASEPCFHRSGTRRIRSLQDLVEDAEIFVPILPLTEHTRGIITSKHLRLLPRGALVILVTRMKICDVPVLRQRVLDGELALAADVFDVEPLPLDDPLLAQPHVIATPHIAGRTRDANLDFADAHLEALAATAH